MLRLCGRRRRLRRGCRRRCRWRGWLWCCGRRRRGRRGRLMLRRSRWLRLLWRRGWPCRLLLLGRRMLRSGTGRMLRLLLFGRRWGRGLGEENRRTFRVRGKRLRRGGSHHQSGGAGQEKRVSLHMRRCSEGRGERTFCRVVQQCIGRAGRRDITCVTILCSRVSDAVPRPAYVTRERSEPMTAGLWQQRKLFSRASMLVGLV